MWLILVPLAHGPFSNQHLPKIFMLLVFAGGMIGRRLYRIYAQRDKPVPLGLPAGPLAIAWSLLPVLLLLPTLFHTIHLISLTEAFLYWTALAGLHFSLSFFNDRDWQLLVAGLPVAGAIAAAYGLVQSLFLPPLHTYLTYVSTFGNVNFAAAYLALVFPWILCWGKLIPFQADTRLRKTSVLLFHWLGGGVVLLYLMRSGSRAAWLGLAAGLVLLALALWRQHNTDVRRPLGNSRRSMARAYGLPTLLIMLLVLLLPTAWRHEFGDRLTSLLHWDRGSLQVRILVWQATWQMIADHQALGCGAGQFVHHFPRYRHPEEYSISGGRLVDDPHNTYLLLLSEGGWAALLAFGLLLGLTLLPLCRQMLARPGDTDQTAQKRELASERAIGTLLAISLVTLLVMGLFACPILWPATALYLPLASAWAQRLEKRRALQQQTSSARPANPMSPANPMTNRRASALGKMAYSLLAITMLLFWSDWLLRKPLADLCFMAGQSHLHRQTFAKATVWLGRAAWLYPDPWYQLEWGRSLLATKEYEQARALFQNLCRRSPELEAAHVDWGLSWAAQGQYPQALAVWQQALPLFPASATLHHNLGKLFLEMRDADQAQHHFLWAGVLEPGRTGQAGHWVNLGLCREIEGQNKEALLLYLQAKEQQPRAAQPYLQIGRLMQKLNLPDQALHNFDQATALGNAAEQALAYFYQAQIYESERQFSQAVALFSMALGKDPTLVSVYLHLAQISVSLQQEPMALGYLQKAKQAGFVQWQTLGQDQTLQQLLHSQVYQTWAK